MSGILAVYALVISVLIASDIKPPPDNTYSLYAGFMHMAAGLSVGLSGLAAGYAIGIVGDAVRVAARRSMEQRLTGTGRALLHAPIENLCRHGAHSHFCRSLGSLRVRLQNTLAGSTSAHVLIASRLIVALILNTRASG